MKTSEELDRYFQCWNHDPCLHSTYLKCYSQEIAHVAESFGIPETAFKCLLFQESWNWRGPRSPDGGIGLGQITPPTDVMVDQLASGQGFPAGDRAKIERNGKLAMNRLTDLVKGPSSNPELIAKYYDDVTFSRTYLANAQIYDQLRADWKRVFEKRNLQPPEEFDLQELNIVDSPVGSAPPKKEKIKAPRSLVTRIATSSTLELEQQLAEMELSVRGDRVVGSFSRTSTSDLLRLRLVRAELKYRNQVREKRIKYASAQKTCAATPRGPSGLGVSDSIVKCPSQERNTADIAGSAVVFKSYFLQLSELLSGSLKRGLGEIEDRMRKHALPGVRSEKYVESLRKKKKVSSGEAILSARGKVSVMPSISKEDFLILATSAYNTGMGNVTHWIGRKPSLAHLLDTRTDEDPEICPDGGYQRSCKINFRHMQSIRRCTQPNSMRGKPIGRNRSGVRPQELNQCPANQFLAAATKFPPIPVPDSMSPGDVAQVTPRESAPPKKGGKKSQAQTVAIPKHRSPGRRPSSGRERAK